MAQGAAGRPARLGRGVPARAQPGRLGLGRRRTGGPRHRHRHPGHHGRGRRRSISWLGLGRWRLASGPGSSSRRGLSGRSADASMSSAATGSWCSLPRREGFGPLLPTGARTERTAEAAGVRLRRLLEDAGGVFIKLGQIAATRVDLLPPELCAELAKLQNRVRPDAARGHRARPRGRVGWARRACVLRVRLGASRRGLDRPDLLRSAPYRRGRRGQGPASWHRGGHGAGSCRARLGGRCRAAANLLRAGDADGRSARPVRPQPSGRARLPAGGGRHGGDGDAAR